MREIPGALINFAGVLLAAFIGTKMATYGQADLWRMEKLFTIQSGYIEKRVETIKSIVEVFTAGQRLAYVNNITGEPPNIISKMLYCSDVDNRRENKNCQDLKPDVDALKQFYDIETNNARFDAASTLARIYFCDGTRETLDALPKGPYWWNVSDARKLQLFETMHRELYCDVSFADVKLKGMK